MVVPRGSRSPLGARSRLGPCPAAFHARRRAGPQPALPGCCARALRHQRLGETPLRGRRRGGAGYADRRGEVGRSASQRPVEGAGLSAERGHQRGRKGRLREAGGRRSWPAGGFSRGLDSRPCDRRSSLSWRARPLPRRQAAYARAATGIGATHLSRRQELSSGRSSAEWQRCAQRGPSRREAAERHRRDAARALRFSQDRRPPASAPGRGSPPRHPPPARGRQVRGGQGPNGPMHAPPPPLGRTHRAVSSRLPSGGRTATVRLRAGFSQCRGPGQEARINRGRAEACRLLGPGGRERGRGGRQNRGVHAPPDLAPTSGPTTSSVRCGQRPVVARQAVDGLATPAPRGAAAGGGVGGADEGSSPRRAWKAGCR